MVAQFSTGILAHFSISIYNKYLTELILVLNHKIWQYYETKPEFATLYNTLWEQAGQYAVENLKDDELSYYYEVTD